MAMLMRWGRRPRHIVLTVTAIFILILAYVHFFTDGPAQRAPPSARRFIPSSYDWSQSKEFFPAPQIKKVPFIGEGRHLREPLPQVQAPLTAFTNPHAPDSRRDEVLRVFQRSWDAYKKYAWLKDELTPVSSGQGGGVGGLGGKETFGGWAATLVDSLDTLWIMDMKQEFREAATAIGRNLDFAEPKSGKALNLFEVTIRHLGGLISAYDLSGDEVLLAKAVELAELLYKGFDTPNRMPVFWLDPEIARKGSQVAYSNDASAAGASLCLEFTRLSQITGNSKYYAAVDKVTRFLEKTQDKTRLPGMWPRTLDLRKEDASSKGLFTLGAQADSLYEYLPKMHALLGGQDPVYEKMYKAAADTAINNLLYRPMLPPDDDGDEIKKKEKKRRGDILFLGDVDVNKDKKHRFIPDSQHLTCFAGGMFGIGGKLLGLENHTDIGERLARGCGWAYSQFPTGLMPEVFGLVPCRSTSEYSLFKDDDKCAWDEQKWQHDSADTTLGKGWRHARDPRYLLRPEAIESIFILYRLTGKDDLRDLAWDMFQAIVNATETDVAYASIRTVREKETRKMNSMEVGCPTLPLTTNLVLSRLVC
jgi:mannosyl-oligosaccharide alpha-1,2-mannosidase